MLRCRLFGHRSWLDLTKTAEVAKEPFEGILDPDLYENVVMLEGPVVRYCIRCDEPLADQEIRSRDCWWPEAVGPGEEPGRYIVLVNGDDLTFIDWARFLNNMRGEKPPHMSVACASLGGVPRIGTRAKG